MILHRTLGTIESLKWAKHNNFDFLRFFAASLVIISHSFALLKLDQPKLGNMTIGSIGVYMFFVISGFLIARSWEMHPRASAFIAKRVLRIVPGLVGVTLFTAFMIGPLLSNLSLVEFIKAPNTFRYLLNSAIFPLHYNLPGVFEANIGGSIVNGSLWTLPLEFISYMGLIALAYLGIFRRRFSFKVLLAVTIVVTCLMLLVMRSPTNPEALFMGIKTIWLVKYGSFFIVGSLYYIYRSHVVLKDWLAVAALGGILLSSVVGGQFVAALIGLPYLVLYLALVPTRYLSRFGARGDFSYGMYIYAWPVQQAIIAMAPQRTELLALIALEFPIIIMLAAVSWYGIEKPSLRLKHRFGKDRYPVMVQSP